jgi:8-oxo-dGTP pyrophosphatase MutT (NUDIX family)
MHPAHHKVPIDETSASQAKARRDPSPEPSCALAIDHHIVHSASMCARTLDLNGSRASSRQLPAKTRIARQSKKPRQQVAAVCYRIRNSGIEFLLVRTRKGRWTFPKGGLEPGLTRAQTAALEAFEEAGVHGRVEEDSFAEYTLDKRDLQTNSRRAKTRIQAHLCEVFQLGRPQESNRNPTWYSPSKAKRRLQEERRAEIGIELASVIDRAVIRIERLQTGSDSANDPLQKVFFESRQAALRLLMEPPAFQEYVSRKQFAGMSSPHRRREKILRLVPAPQLEP